VKQKLGHVAYLEALLGAELEERERHAVARRITEAKFPKVKTLEDVHFEEAPIIRLRKFANWPKEDICVGAFPVGTVFLPWGQDLIIR